MRKMPKPKPYHRAALVDADGNVSALCFARPRPIDLRRALWTTIDASVTCPKCLKLIAEGDAPKGTP